MKPSLCSVRAYVFRIECGAALPRNRNICETFRKSFQTACLVLCLHLFSLCGKMKISPDILKQSRLSFSGSLTRLRLPVFCSTTVKRSCWSCSVLKERTSEILNPVHIATKHASRFSRVSALSIAFSAVSSIAFVRIFPPPFCAGFTVPKMSTQKNTARYVAHRSLSLPVNRPATQPKRFCMNCHLLYHK